jgi:hypothetical protein
MSDQNNNDVNNKFPHLSPERALNAEKSAIKLAHVSAIKRLKGDNDWTILEELLQEIQSNHSIANPGNMPSWKAMHAELEREVQKRYVDDEELLNLLINGIPSVASLQKWPKKKGWTEAVWSKIKSDTLFSSSRRAAMINALYERGIQKDTAAAKMYLTMSGDYSERPPEEKNAALNQYREINNILHKKNS